MIAAARVALARPARPVVATASARTHAPIAATIHQAGLVADANPLARGPCRPAARTDPVTATPSDEPTCRLVEAIPESHTDVYEWYVRTKRYGPPDSMTMAQTVPIDDRQLFDRATDWPTDHRRTSVVATEQVVQEGATLPGMVKAVFMVAKKPGLTVQEFQQHWLNVHGPLVSKLPGLRRYVQNPAVLEAYALRPMTHDGFSELWFDDLASLQNAATTPEWHAVAEDAHTLFADPVGLVIAREGIRKEVGAFPRP